MVACGAEASTFGIQGVLENAIFLREVHHAQEIRRKLLLNLMLSDTPGKNKNQLHQNQKLESEHKLDIFQFRDIERGETEAVTLRCCWRWTNWC